MKAPAWLDYESGVSLGEFDGEMRVHTDDAGNIWILGWRSWEDDSEPRRDDGYDGGLGPEQEERLRVLLNERAAKRSK